MTAPARATAGVAFRLQWPKPPVTVREDHLARGARVRAYVDLLRRLLAAQPAAGYPGHQLHLAVLKGGEAWLPFFEDRGPAPEGVRVTLDDLDEALSDFGPRGLRFSEHPDKPGLYGWWPRLDRGPLKYGRDFAAQIEAERRCAALADVEAELPPEAPGAPALPAAAPAAETPEKRLARLKRQLVPLAAVHYDTPPAQLPQEVVDLLVDIADAAGGDMAQAITAWRAACSAVGAE